MAALAPLSPPRRYPPVIIGLRPARTGALRLSNGESVYSRNAADSADVLLIGLDSTNALTGQVATDIAAAQANAEASAASDLSGHQTSGVHTILAIGTTPATSGTVRIPSAGTVAFRNNANSADLTVLSKDTSDNVVLGTTSGGISSAAAFKVAQSTGHLTISSASSGAVITVEKSASSQAALNFDGYNTTGASSPVLRFRRSLGLKGSEAVPVTNTSLGVFAALGWDGTTFNTGAQVEFLSATTYSSTDRYSKIVFWAAPSGTTSVVRMLDMDPQATDGCNLIVGTTTGLKIGTSTSQKLGFYNATPITQRSGAAQAAVTTTAATNVAPFGYTTQAQADAIVTLVNELRAWAVAQGFIKGSA